MNSKKVVKVACQGAGYFAQFHYDAWNRIDGAEVVAAIDHDTAKAEATGSPAFASFNDAMAATSPDLLDIITPPPTHLDAIRNAIDRGVRAIICQKPFCTSLEDARQAVELAQVAGVPLVVHENYRFQPWYRAIKKEIDNKRLGDLLQMTFRLRPGDGQGPEAYLDRQPYFQTMEKFLIHETAIHWVDTFRFLAGEPDSVYADLRQLNPAIAGEDAGYFIFSYENGMRALFDGNRLLDHAAENHRLTMGEALIEGTAGALSLFGDGSVTFRAFGGREQEIVFAKQDHIGFAGDCVHALQSHVVDGLLNDGAFENQARDYLRNLELEQAIYRSNETGARVGV
ncbi:MAG: Gfo/Idh/MocA family oxidoreductase [Pseudomonadota bacterium]